MPIPSKEETVPVWANNLLTEVKLSKEVSMENQRTLRGHNGDIGLVGRVDQLEKRVDLIWKGIVTIILFVVTTGLGLFIQHIMAGN